jgi:hypothetical protein
VTRHAALTLRAADVTGVAQQFYCWPLRTHTTGGACISRQVAVHAEGDGPETCRACPTGYGVASRCGVAFGHVGEQPAEDVA